jgi:hypothetical protein
MCEYLLQVRLADPDIVSDPSEYQKLAQSVAELDQVFSLLMMEFILLLVSTQLQWDVSLSTVRFYIALFFFWPILFRL